MGGVKKGGVKKGGGDEYSIGDQVNAAPQGGATRPDKAH